MRTKETHSPVWVDSQPLLHEWYSSALGQSILVQLDKHLGSILPAVFGYQGLQLGSLGTSVSFLEKAGIHRTLILDSPNGKFTRTDDKEQVEIEPSVDTQIDTQIDTQNNVQDNANSGLSLPDDPLKEGNQVEPPADLQAPQMAADVLNLPIANDVMKIVMLPHTLDFCNDPYQVLREADRVLTADGHMVIIGFSPWSQFGMRRSIIRWQRNVPWSGSFYSRNRVTDWLSVLNYRVHDSRAFYLRPPIQSVKVLERMKLLEKNQRWLGLLGGLYLLHVRKQTLPMTPAKRPWIPQRQRLQVGSLVRAREESAGTTAARRKIQPGNQENNDS